MDEIYSLIRKVGIGAKYKGYRYLAEAIHLTILDENSLRHITKNIYPPVAEQFHVSTYSVEQGIRTVIDVCWNKNKSLLEEISGCRLSEKPTNSEFIDILSYYLKENGK